ETADASKFSTDDVKSLMDAVRIVFVTPVVESGELTGYTILHMAKPDITEATTLTDTVTAPIAFYEFSSELVDPNAEDDFKEVKVNLGTKKDTYVVTMLQQNQAQQVSVIVYLDGDAVDNTMVANAKTSMTGKLNLQFATDANLVPMDVASLKVSAAESLQQVVDAIKADTIYTDAQAAADPTAAQTALLDAVDAADAALAADPQVQADILSAAQALKTAALAAGIPAEAIGY
ncbi:MAG: hypothetical protein ILP01_02840, partial [Clostridia bacterium]|nr:hypothetical protein [Clostridia bacterium]